MEPSDFSVQIRLVRIWIPFVLALIAGCSGAILGWLAAPEWRIVAVVIAFLAGFAGMSLFIMLLRAFYTSLTSSVNYQMNHVMNRIYHSEVELRSMINIRPLMKDSLLGFGGWAVDARLAERLVMLLKEVRRHSNFSVLVVECGSGTSTVFIARYLKLAGSGTLLSLEHEPDFAAATRQALQELDLDDVVTVLEAPLRPRQIDGEEMLWYDVDPGTFLQQPIDLLFVDGPPGKTGPLARYPAVPVFKKWLHPGSIIVLDDGHRDDEKEIAERWASELGITPEFQPGGKGTWIIRNSSKQTITNEKHL